MSKRGRPVKKDAVQEKLDKYLNEYELSDLNEANDLASLNALCRQEVLIEKLQAALDGIKNLEADSRIVKDLNTSLKDSLRSYLDLQVELGINRRKREADNEETPLTYIGRLQDQAKRFLDMRLVTIKCEDCKLPLAKYYIYVREKGERGSIKYGDKVDPIAYSFSVECPRCGKMVEHNHANRKG